MEGRKEDGRVLVWVGCARDDDVDRYKSLSPFEDINIIEKSLELTSTQDMLLDFLL